ncbi:MAG: SpoIIE family protein phosphatase [Bacteroidales bacterium]|jgi:sigma-B regulation protein RsbU (phosphoserine phosphatase)|nr:SpoIIE family protein phosphatase [Bacteroidales bacterium]
MIEKNSARQTLKFKLDSLLDITLSINENQPVEALLENYINILCVRLKIGKVLMFKHTHEWECILMEGVSAEVVAHIDVERYLLPFSEITFITSEKTVFPGFDIIIPVYNNNIPIAFVLIGDIEEEMEGVSPVIKHLQFIQTISNIIVVAIENIRLFQESLRQEAMKKELELASQMQNLLVPGVQDLPHNDHVRMTAFYKPHYEVGGDYFDCISLNENELGFCVADVSGKGIAAALLMSNFQATLRALFTSDIDMKKLVQRLNRRVSESAQCEKFITLFIARYNYTTRILEYVNAGHTSAILYGIKTRQMKLLESATVALGVFEDMTHVTTSRIAVDEHSLLLAYTDGIVEVLSDTEQNRVDSAFYVLENAIRQCPHIDEAMDDIIREQNLKGNNNAIFDDITMLGIEFF